MRLPYLSQEDLIVTLKIHEVYSPKVVKALKKATKLHKKQLRDNKTPYLEEHIYPVTADIIDAYKPNKVTPY